MLNVKVNHSTMRESLNKLPGEGISAGQLRFGKFHLNKLQDHQNIILWTDKSKV